MFLPLCSAVQSPHILEQSGIGRADILKKIDIPVKLDLPGVGENLQEHLFIGISFGTESQTNKTFRMLSATVYLELKDHVKWETLDLLRDPAIAAKHLDLQ